MAPFTQEQIVALAQKWFATLAKTNAEDEADSAVQFITFLSKLLG